MKEMLTPDEVAEMLGVSRITIYRLIDKRELPVYRIGRQLRFRREEVQDYLKRVRRNAL